MEIGNSLEGLKSLLGLSAPSPPVSGSRSQGTAGASAPDGDRAASDRVTLTSAASEVSQAAGEDGVRTEWVAQVQAAIAAGTYNVPAAAVASKVVDAMLAAGQ